MRPHTRGLPFAGESPTGPWLANYPSWVPHHLDYPEEPVYWLLERAARGAPGRIACRYYNQRLTYAELLRQARQMSTVLRSRGLEPGDRVALLLPNIPEYVIALFGTWMAGGTVVPLNPMMVAEEAVSLLRATDARFVVALDVLLPMISGDNAPDLDLLLVTTLRDRLPRWQRWGYSIMRWKRLGFRSPIRGNVHRFQDVLNAALPQQDPLRPDLDSPAYILPTGGTTGHPKAVVLSHRNLLANAWQLYHWSGARFSQDIMLAVLPFFHSYGLSACLLNSMAMAGTLVMHHRFVPETVLQLIERQRPGMFLAVPAMFVALNKVLRKRRYDLSSLQYCISGGAPLDPHVAAEFSDRSGAIVVEGYGLSEASPVTHTGPLDGTAKPGTVGLPLPDTNVCIVDAETGTRVLGPNEVGEVLISGPQVMSGYYNDPEATAHALQAGWLHTGDLGTCDEQGFFRIVDRKKDLIITSGCNVYPTDVEQVLRQYPGLADVAIVGVPDGDRGELVKAIVTMEKGKQFNRHDFDAFAHLHLAAYKRPRMVEVLRGDLPRNPLGKVLRRQLRAPATEAAPTIESTPTGG